MLSGLGWGLMLVVAATGPVSPNRSLQIMRELGMELAPDALKAAIAKAETHPLGSRDNPVRASDPDGQRAYLARLRCDDGKAPKFDRAGNVGSGPYTYFVDDYRVTCRGKPPVSIYLDMYHEHVETRSVTGFTIVD